MTGLTQGEGAVPSGAGEALNPPHVFFTPDPDEQLRWAQKMEALAHLSGRMVHEIRNQMTLVLGRVALSLGRTDTTPSTLADLDEIQHAAQQVARLTREWLTLSRKEAPRAHPLDLNGLLDNRLRTIDLCLGKNIELVFVHRANQALIWADRGHLEQVILNLALNARDAMAGPGLLTVSTANVLLTGAEDDLLLPCPPGRYVQLAVNDTGCGMDAATLARIFEPYFTTKASGRGTGLGLYHVREIVREYRGTLRVTSVPGRGATFDLFFPQWAGEETVPTEKPVALKASESGTILLIEDDDSVRALVREVLRRQGYTVLEASLGDEAIQICADHGSPVDLLVTDRGLPDMSGREVARRLTDLYPALRVLHISGYSGDQDFAPGAMDPGVPFLQKPFTAAELSATVRDLLTR